MKRMKTITKKKVKKNSISQVEILKSTRKSWGGFNPVTRIVPNKKKAKVRNKHNCWRNYV